MGLRVSYNISTYLFNATWNIKWWNIIRTIIETFVHCLVCNLVPIYSMFIIAQRRDESIEDVLECGIDPRTQCAHKNQKFLWRCRCLFDTPKKTKTNILNDWLRKIVYNMDWVRIYDQIFRQQWESNSLECVWCLMYCDLNF